MRASTRIAASLVVLALAPACAASPEPAPLSMPRPAYPSQPASMPAPTYPPPAYAAPAYAAPGAHQAPGPSSFAGGSYLTPQVGVVPPNAIALRALQTSPCAPEEVAPGVWASFDCSNPEPMRRASAFVQRFQAFAGPLPIVVDHRAFGLEGPVKDQGAVGACTAFSLSTAMESAVRRMGRQDVISPLHIWSKYGIPMMGLAGDQNVEERIALEPSWPYDPVKACKLTRQPLDSCGSAYGVASGTGVFDPRLRAEQKVADAAGRYRLVSVEQLNTSPVSPQEIAAVLASGDDLWASFWVDTNAWKHRSLSNGVIPEYQRRGSSGHAVVIAGYRTIGLSRQFLIHNSWSERWGEGGYGWISESMVVRHLRAAYRVRVADASGAAPPAPPSPQPQPPPAGDCPSGQAKAPVFGVCLPAIPGFSIPTPPVPGACAQGQVLDLMTGQCAPACPGGASAVGGLCVPVLPFPGR